MHAYFISTSLKTSPYSTSLWYQKKCASVISYRNRSQQVVIDGCYSTPCDVVSGVLQGLIFGSTLFLLYINDIAADIQSTIRLCRSLFNL